MSLKRNPKKKKIIQLQIQIQMQIHTQTTKPDPMQILIQSTSIYLDSIVPTCD